jgi:spore coat protein U-like protein
MKINKNWIPVFIAIALGTAAMTYYIVSGRSGYDSGVRNLANGKTIEKISAADSKSIRINCKNGENYEIAFSDAQANYEDAIFNACGPEGTQE